jgi:hypothetical protein
MPAASISNYYIGTGVVTWTPLGSNTPVDLGNCPKFEFDPKNQAIAHYSSRLGRKFKDDHRIVAMEPSITLTLDEWTQENLALALVGSQNGNQVNLMDLADIRGQLVFTGANSVGPKKKITLPLVVLIPAGKMELINAGQYGEIEITGEVLGDPTTGSFGNIIDIGTLT